MSPRLSSSTGHKTHVWTPWCAQLRRLFGIRRRPASRESGALGDGLCGSGWLCTAVARFLSWTNAVAHTTSCCGMTPSSSVNVRSISGTPVVTGLSSGCQGDSGEQRGPRSCPAEPGSSWGDDRCRHVEGRTGVGGRVTRQEAVGRRWTLDVARDVPMIQGM